jgi:hypothetical protein
MHCQPHNLSTIICAILFIRCLVNDAIRNPDSMASTGNTTNSVAWVHERTIPPLWSSGQSSWLQNGDVFCFLWGTNLNYMCHVEESRSPLWSSGQSSWLQIQKRGFDSRRYQIFWEVVVLERCSLSLVSTIEELRRRNSSGSGLEIRDYDLRDPSRWSRDIFHPQKVETNFADMRRCLVYWEYNSE